MNILVLHLVAWGAWGALGKGTEIPDAWEKGLLGS